jgi:hypothetical protein
MTGLAAALACVAISACGAAAAEMQLVVTPAAAGSDVPVCVEISLPAELAGAKPDQVAVTMKSADGAAAPGQVVRIGDGPARLAWIIPSVKADEKQKWTATLAKGAPAGEAFSWKDEPGKHLDLLLAGKCVTRYMYERDTSTKEKAHATYKVYTHVMDAEGSDTITKGPGGQYTHHRGIFLGYNRTGYDADKRGDWWHMKAGNLPVTQEHQKFLSLVAGPVAARSTTLIHWNDPDGKPVVVEEREQTVWRQPAPAMLLFDFRAKLTAARSDIDLNGDPEHAGMQFRPHNDVNRKTTKYLFPDEKVTRANVSKERDLAWAAECYELRGKQYTVQHMNHPDNPKGTRYSAYRDYGRFGTFAAAKVKQGESLTLLHRIWVAEGDHLSREEMQARWEAFAHAPKVEAAK